MEDLRNIIKMMGSRIGGVPFEPARDIPSLAGKVILLTGGASGLGKETAVQLARHGRPARLYIADLPPRDGAGGQALVDRLTQEASRNEGITSESSDPRTEIRFLELDLGSFDSIRRCAAAFVAQEERLDILILNAGIIRLATGVTTEGYESHFGINFVGHALLAKLLMPVVLRTAEAHSERPRIVVVSSEGWAMAPKPGILFDRLKTDGKGMSYMSRYGQSKLALILLARQLAELHPQIDVAAIHPGKVATEIGAGLGKESKLIRFTAPLVQNFGLKLATPVSEGAKNHLWTATSPAVVSGKYYEPVGVPDKEGEIARDDKLREKLWTWTESEYKDVAPLQ